MIEVIDNVISEKYSKLIFDRCAQLDWRFVPDISFGEQNTNSVPGFNHTLYLHQNYNKIEKKEIISSAYDLFAPVLLESFDKLKLNADLKNVFRSRARLTIQKSGLNEEDRIDTPHRDYSFPHLVLIYYVNTIDGDTVLYHNNSIIEKISPKRGRICFFNGSIIHASSSPSLGPRIIINNNIILEQ
jgi:hypothetical protein